MVFSLQTNLINIYFMNYSIRTVGPNPRVEQASNNYKKHFKRGVPRAERFEAFVTSAEFQLFCLEEELEPNMFFQLCLSQDEEIHFVRSGKPVWAPGITYRKGLESFGAVKTVRYINPLGRCEYYLVAILTYWLSKDEQGVWHAELVSDDDIFLSEQATDVVFDRAAELLGGFVSESCLAEAKLFWRGRVKQSVFRLATVELSNGEQCVLAISFDNGALVVVEPQQIEVVSRLSPRVNEMVRTRYNWFKYEEGGNFSRMK